MMGIDSLPGSLRLLLGIWVDQNETCAASWWGLSSQLCWFVAVRWSHHYGPASLHTQAFFSCKCSAVPKRTFLFTVWTWPCFFLGIKFRARKFTVGTTRAFAVLNWWISARPLDKTMSRVTCVANRLQTMGRSCKSTRKESWYSASTSNNHVKHVDILPCVQVLLVLVLVLVVVLVVVVAVVAVAPPPRCNPSSRGRSLSQSPDGWPATHLKDMVLKGCSKISFRIICQNIYIYVFCKWWFLCMVTQKTLTFWSYQISSYMWALQMGKQYESKATTLQWPSILQLSVYNNYNIL